MKKLALFTLAFIGVLAASAVAFASSEETAALAVIGNVALAAGIGIGLGVVGPGIGQGICMYGALSGMARNPEQTGTLRVYMLIGLALIESLAIYALVVSLILLYAFPYSGRLAQYLGAVS
ncbi:MAG: ATP synthase F0 subunit C [Deltaproteobacteria bacterium]|jgi:F-type H+-transporting ATPase subunit c|nr:ATP synthase F0 subunit C [Deltaproteobacteria bacterium]